MFKRIADNRDDTSLATQFRKRRFAFFLSLLARVERLVRILDIGGTEEYWKKMDLNDDQVTVTLLNLTAQEVLLPYMTIVAGDARNSQQTDLSFDVVFSNSVIEHLGTYQDQSKIAREVRRVGKRYFIQTPKNISLSSRIFCFRFINFFRCRCECCCCGGSNWAGCPEPWMQIKPGRLWRKSAPSTSMNSRVCSRVRTSTRGRFLA